MSTVDSGAAAPAAPAPAPAAPAAGAPAATNPPADNNAPAENQPGETVEGTKTPEQIEAERIAAEAANKPAGAPEKYEPFTPPEGAALDSTVMEQFAGAAKELNLPQEKAQQLIDKMAPIMAQRQAEQIQQTAAAWADQCMADKEFGGDKLTESKAVAARAMDKFATPELRAMLNESGLGNHPELMRMMVKVGRAISEERHVSGGVPPSGGRIRTPAEVLYPASSLKP